MTSILSHTKYCNSRGRLQDGPLNWHLPIKVDRAGLTVYAELLNRLVTKGKLSLG